MNIKKVKINNFGKLNNKDFVFGKRINIIYGNNEAGKSTLLKFINGMLFGLSKNKNGEIISEYDKYKPWQSIDYSGKIDYELDNGNLYEVYRDFNKKNPIIYNEFGEDISNIYKKNKTNGISFFEEQCGIDKELYISTAIVEQEKTRLKSSSQINIINKITNMVSTGDDVISYKDTITKIKNEQIEKIGSDRTIQKPINRVNSQIDYLNKEKIKLAKYRNNYINNENDRDDINTLLEKEKRKVQLLKIEKKNLDNNHIIESEIELLNKNKKEIENKIYELQEKADEKNQINKIKKEQLIKEIIYILISALVIILNLIFIDNKLIKSITSGLVLLVMIFLVIRGLSKVRKTIKEKEYNKTNIKKDKLYSEISILKDSYDDICDKYNKKNKEFDELIEIQYNELLDYCESNEEKNYINSIFDMSEHEIVEQIESKSNNIYEAEVKLRLLNQDIENSNQKIEELIQLEEQLNYYYGEKEKLLYLNNIYNMTKKCIEEAYLDVKKNISPYYKNNLSAIINKLSSGKYSRVEINDEKIVVETNHGELVPISQLSTGTIDQIYLSLRLSVIKEITNENLPIFFDETFSYFDDERLENILNYINEEYSNRQVCIFSCSKREIEILDKMNIDFNLINL